MSRSRTDLTYLRDILDAIQAIQDFTQGYDYESFVSDRKTRDAVVRNLEVVGEAVKKLSRSIKARYPQVEWKSIAGLRDVLIHDYFGVNYELCRGLGNRDREATAFERRDRKNYPVGTNLVA